MFTSEPLYVGGESFRAMRISATYGHGEGVVGEQGIASDTSLLLISEAHPDQLYIFYDTKLKPERLAPVMTKDGVVLGKVPNPGSLQGRPTLDSELLIRLYHWGVIGEKFFDDHPTDMEIVIKGKTIYPVQARPVNRPDLLPTYFDIKKVVALADNPIQQKIQAEMLVPGKASVVIVTNLNEVLIAPTLGEAEKLFVKGQHKLVLVTKREPANSHPVVNFSSLGMPCLVVENAENVRNFIDKIDEGHPLAACVQSATLNLLDSSKANTESLISRGFAVHPAKVAISLNVANKSSIEKPTPVPQEVKDLVLIIRSAATQEVAKDALHRLKEHNWVQGIKQRKEELAAHLKSLHIVSEQVRETFSILQSLEERVSLAFEEAEAALTRAQDQERLRSLLHVKVIETLLFTPSTGSTISQYSLLDVEPLHKEALAIIEYQKQLPYPAHFQDILMLGARAFDHVMRQRWTNFLLQLEPLAEKGEIHKSKIIQLKKLINILDQAGLLTTWMNVFLPTSIQNDPKKALENILNGFPLEEGTIIQQMLKIASSLKKTKEHIDLFANPKTFPQYWKSLQKTASDLSSNLKGQLSKASPLSRILILKSMEELVDVFDTAIKTMKASSQWNEGEKTKLFKEMLAPYLDLLQDWGANLIDLQAIPTHSAWSLSEYLSRMNELFNAMPDNLPEHLRSSPNFSVAAAVLGAMTAFERHYPQHLEDMFTLIHQNLLASISSLSKSVYTEEQLQQSVFPEAFKNVLWQITLNVGRNIQRTGIEVSEKGVDAKYNVPLRNHSAQMILKYDEATGKVTLKGSLLGEARDRWELSKQMAEALSEAEILPLSEPILIGEQEVVISWQINSQEHMALALNEFFTMCDISLDTRLERNAIRELISRHTASAISDQHLHELGLNIIKYFVHRLHPVDHTVYAEYLDHLQAQSKGQMIDYLKFPVRAIFPAVAIKSPDYAKAILEAVINIGEADEALQSYNIDIDDKIFITSLVKQFHQNPRDLFEAIKSMFRSRLSFYRLKNIIDFCLDKGIWIEFIEALVASGSSDENEEVRQKSLLLAWSLVEKGYGIETAIRLVEKGMLDERDDVRQDSIRLAKILVENGHGIDVAIRISENGISDPASIVRDEAFFLIKSLMKKEHGIDVAIHIFKKGILDAHTDTRINILKLTAILAKNVEGIKAAIDISEIGFFDIDSRVSYFSFEIINDLVKRGHGIDVAIGISEKGILDKDGGIRKLSLVLATTLVNIGQGIDAAIPIAEKGILDANEDIREYALELAEALAKNEEGIKTALVISEEGFFDTNMFVRSRSFRLIVDLVEKGDGIETAIRLVEKGMLDERQQVRENAEALGLELKKIRGSQDGQV